MKIKRILVFIMTAILCAGLVGCREEKKDTKKHITLKIKTAPMSLGTITNLGEAEIYDLFMAAAEKFREQYDRYDVDFEIARYDFQEEEEQLVDKRGTDDAADIFYAGSQNVPEYAANGWLAPLNDMIDEELRSDIDETIWEQNTIDGKVYTMPYQQLQSTLLVNKAMMEEAGLGQYIPEKDTIAQWSLDEFDVVLHSLKESITAENRYVFPMYAANEQGDSHIMTLLRSRGGNLYDDNGRFAVNTPEGIAALQWIKTLEEEGIVPKDAENLGLSDCVNLFNNGQLAILPGDITGLRDASDSGVEAFALNFPSPDGKGYCTSSTNGFCVFDNGDKDKVRAAKDFIRFIYTDEELMKYTLGTLPVNHSVIEKFGKDIPMLSAYGGNMANSVDNIRNNQNWQEVRDVFYVNIQNLLTGSRAPAEAAEDIDQSCNEALGLECKKELPKKLRGG